MGQFKTLSLLICWAIYRRTPVQSNITVTQFYSNIIIYQ